MHYVNWNPVMPASYRTVGIFQTAHTIGFSSSIVNKWHCSAWHAVRK